MARITYIPCPIRRKKTQKSFQVRQNSFNALQSLIAINNYKVNQVAYVNFPRLVSFILYKIGCFDVYNIETALPVIDMETIENHLKLVKEDERRVSNSPLC